MDGLPGLLHLSAGLRAAHVSGDLCTPGSAPVRGAAGFGVAAAGGVSGTAAALQEPRQQVHRWHEASSDRRPLQHWTIYTTKWNLIWYRISVALAIHTWSTKHALVSCWC